jgi:hypothetical protein
MRPSATAGFRCGLIPTYADSPVVRFSVALFPIAANSQLHLPQVKLPFEPLRRKARSNPTAIPSAIADGDADETWDQFAENERLYGVRTDFDEEMCACFLFVFAKFICMCVRCIIRLCVRVCSLNAAACVLATAFICACVFARCSCVCLRYIIHSPVHVCSLHSFIHSSVRVSHRPSTGTRQSSTRPNFPPSSSPAPVRPVTSPTVPYPIRSNVFRSSPVASDRIPTPSGHAPHAIALRPLRARTARSGHPHRFGTLF